MSQTSDDRIVTASEAALILLLRSRKSLDRMRRRGAGPRFCTLGNGSKPASDIGWVTSWLSFDRPTTVSAINCN